MTEPVVDDELDGSLAAARSDAWQDRANAAAVLARVDDPRATAVLGRLLLDADDTAVVESALRALAARADPYGAHLIFAALAEADGFADDHLVSVQLFFLARDVDLLETSGLYRAAHEAATHPDEAVRTGARILVDYLSGAI